MVAKGRSLEMSERRVAAVERRVEVVVAAAVVEEEEEVAVFTVVELVRETKDVR